MGFIDIAKVPTIEPVPGCRMRTPFGENLMLSYLEMDEGAEVPFWTNMREYSPLAVAQGQDLQAGTRGTRMIAN